MALPASDDYEIPASQLHRLTVEEYLRLADTDDPAWAHTELIEGVVYDVTPQHDRHASAIMCLLRLLFDVFPDDEIRTASSVRLSPVSLVEPDVFVFRGGIAYDDMQPIDAGLLKMAVEVSVSTLRTDVGPKMVSYGRAGVPIYWVVDPTPGGAYLLTHTEPCPTGYRRVRRIELPDGVAGLDVADALAG